MFHVGWILNILYYVLHFLSGEKKRSSKVVCLSDSFIFVAYDILTVVHSSSFISCFEGRKQVV